MNAFIEAIQTATGTDASDEARAAGAAACRAILASLEPSTQLARALPAALSAQMPQLIAMLSKMDINELLDVAIERLRALNGTNPSATAAAPVRRMQIPLVPIPPTLRSRS